MNIVIIGNSAAAVGCVESIRKYDRDSAITVISDEPWHTYSRPLISYLLLGRTDEQRMKYRPDSFYTDNNVTALLGKKAEHVDAKAKTITLDDGKKLPYDKLLIATGSHPFVPPTTGLDSTPYHTFMTLNDAKALEKDLTPDSRVLIVGAGLIGLKCAEGILARVKSIDVVDMADRVLPSILDETGSNMIQTYLESKGLRFTLSDCVSEFKNGTAVLKSGKTLAYDVVVMAVGVRPNVELAKEIGADVNRGIVVDDYCRTSVADVYAAGDCSEATDVATGTKHIMALLPNAYMQGEVVGTHMTGGDDKPYDHAIPMNAIGFFGYHVITAGSYTGDDRITRDGDSYKRLFYKDNVLKGYILIGKVERAGIYTSLIREKTPLDSIDFDLIAEAPQLMAFSAEKRAHDLARRSL